MGNRPKGFGELKEDESVGGEGDEGDAMFFLLSWGSGIAKCERCCQEFLQSLLR